MASESSLQPLGLSLNLKLAISARLTSQQDPRICLSLLLSVVVGYHNTSFENGCWDSKLRLVQWVLCPSSSLSSPVMGLTGLTGESGLPGYGCHCESNHSQRLEKLIQCHPTQQAVSRTSELCQPTISDL